LGSPPAAASRSATGPASSGIAATTSSCAGAVSICAAEAASARAAGEHRAGAGDLLARRRGRGRGLKVEPVVVRFPGDLGLGGDLRCGGDLWCGLGLFAGDANLRRGHLDIGDLVFRRGRAGDVAAAAEQHPAALKPGERDQHRGDAHQQWLAPALQQRAERGGFGVPGLAAFATLAPGRRAALQRLGLDRRRLCGAASGRDEIGPRGIAARAVRRRGTLVADAAHDRVQVRRAGAGL
jgi:hypothetical protein